MPRARQGLERMAHLRRTRRSAGRGPPDRGERRGVAGVTSRGRGHGDSTTDTARSRRRRDAGGTRPGVAGRRRRGALPHRRARRPPRERRAGAPGGDSLRHRAAEDGAGKPRGGSAQRGSLPRRGERQSHLSTRVEPASAARGGGAEPSPRGKHYGPRPPRAVDLHRLCEPRDPSSSGNASPAVAQLAHGRRIPGSCGLSGRRPRGSATPAPRRSSPTDLPAQRNDRDGPGAPVAAHRRDGGRRRPRFPERHRRSVPART